MNDLEDDLEEVTSSSIPNLCIKGLLPLPHGPAAYPRSGPVSIFTR